MTTLVNIHKSEYDVYIGRAGHGFDGYFGNPKEHSFGGVGLDTIIERYKTYFYKRIGEDSHFRTRVADLKGKILGCFCLPRKCHGMVIIEYLEGIPIEEQMIRKIRVPKIPQSYQSIDIFAE